MKKLLFIAALTGIVLASCSKDTVEPPLPKSVIVGIQKSTPTAGIFGLVAYDVTTTNIANGDYTATVSNLPTGVTIDPLVQITNNKGTLYLLCSVTAAAGTTNNLTLNLSGVTSAPFTLNIIANPGDGTAGNPFKVGTLADLQKVGKETTVGGWTRTAHYLQTANITSSGAWTPIGSSSANAFTGSYDGGGYTISGLNINRTADYNGLFGYISGGTVKNLAVASVDITGGQYTGAIAGYMGSGTISNCYVTGKVAGTNSHVGGMIGSIMGGSITNCYTTATVSCTGTNGRVGGIAGHFQNGSITNCYATGEITGVQLVGGIVGTYASGTNAIKDCVALNPRISRHGTGTETSFGRVFTGSLTGANNYARHDIGGTTTLFTAKTTTGKDGENINSAQWNSASFWGGSSTANFSTANWRILNRLPTLKTTTGGDFSQEQNPDLIN